MLLRVRVRPGGLARHVRCPAVTPMDTHGQRELRERHFPQVVGLEGDFVASVCVFCEEK